MGVRRQIPALRRPLPGRSGTSPPASIRSWRRRSRRRRRRSLPVDDVARFRHLDKPREAGRTADHIACHPLDACPVVGSQIQRLVGMKARMRPATHILNHFRLDCSATIILSLEQQLEFPSFPSKNQRRAAPPFVKRSAAERNKRGGGTPHAADAPSRPLRRLGRLGPLGLLQPVTGDVQLQDHAVMHQAVDRRRRRHRVLENHFPLRER